MRTVALDINCVSRKWFVIFFHTSSTFLYTI
jgi:hypothetical protein